MVENILAWVALHPIDTAIILLVVFILSIIYGQVKMKSCRL